MQEAKDRAREREPFVVDERIRRMIAGAVAEVDPAQIAVLRRLTPAQRFTQMISMIRFTEKSTAHRLCNREPALSEAEALKVVRSGYVIQWLTEHRKQKQGVT